MLDPVKAIGYVNAVRLESGASEPLIVRVSASNNDQFETYVKLTDKLLVGIKALIIESISSMLARDLELPTPEPFIVNIDQDFIDSVHDESIRQRLTISAKETFGTRALPVGSKSVLKGAALKKEQLDLAAYILIFDALIENDDRGAQGKVNCLTDGSGFFVIDHEKAFPNAAGLPLLGRKLPWNLGGLDRYSAPNTHLFINQLRGQFSKLNLNPFVSRWKQVVDSRLNEYLGALPPNWVMQSDHMACAVDILDSIKQIRENIDTALIEIKRVLG